MCELCGQLSANYNNCDRCHRELPDNVKYYFPNKTPTSRAERDAKNEQLIMANQGKLTQARILAQQDFVSKEKFYGNKSQVVVQSGSGPALGNPTRKVAGRLSLKRKQTEPGMCVCVCVCACRCVSGRARVGGRKWLAGWQSEVHTVHALSIISDGLRGSYMVCMS